MAIKKEIQKPNGVVLNYHRIASVKIEVNQQCTILVESYLNEDGRNYEKAYAAGEVDGREVMPYTFAEYLHLEYNPELNVRSAYEWLKQQPEFEGAEDV